MDKESLSRINNISSLIDSHKSDIFHCQNAINRIDGYDIRIDVVVGGYNASISKLAAIGFLSDHKAYIESELKKLQEEFEAS